MLLNNETGKFYISTYSGTAIAFGFQGDKDFINRAYNLAVNYGITNGALHQLYNNLFYVVTKEERILKGLKECFYAELARIKGKFSCPKDKFGNEILEEISIDNEAELESDARQQAQIFFNEKIIREKFIPVYS